MGRLYLFLMVLFGFLGAQVREANRIEVTVQRQVESYLSQILPPNSYLVTTSAKVVVNRTPEVAEEVTDSLKEESTAAQVNIVPPVPKKRFSQSEHLPGLEPIREDIYLLNNTLPSRPPVQNRQKKVPSQPNTKHQRTTTTKNYHYKEEIVLEELSVQVLLDQSLDQELVATVKKVLAEKISLSYGDKGVVLFSTANILKNNFIQQQDQELEQTIKEIKDVDYYLAKYGFLASMFFAIFLFFIVLLIFLFFTWLFIRILTSRQQEERMMYMRSLNAIPKRQSPPPQLPPYQPNFPYSPYGGYGYDPRIPPNNYPPPDSPVNSRRGLPAPAEVRQKKKTLVELEEDKKKMIISRGRELDELKKRSLEKEEEFLEKFTNDPLTARNFFFNLNNDEQEELIGAFPKNSTRRILGRLNVSGFDVEKKSKLDKVENLVERERLRQKIFDQYLDSLTRHQKILEVQNKDVFGQISLLTNDEINLLFSSLDPRSIVHSYQIIDSDLISNYLEKLPDQKKNQFMRALKEEKAITEDEISRLKQIYRNRINTISRNIFVSKPNQDELQDKVFRTVKDKKAFLENIRESDPDFYNKHKRYAV